MKQWSIATLLLSAVISAQARAPVASGQRGMRKAPAISFKGKDISGHKFLGRNLRRVDLRVKRAHLAAFASEVVPTANGDKRIRTDLSGANAQGANLSGAWFLECIMRGINFNNAQLEQARLEDVDLTDATFDGASLTRAELRRANCSNASFKDANLEKATLDQVTLTGANLQGANFTGATFKNGTNLLEAQNLSGTILIGAKGLAKVLKQLQKKKTIQEKGAALFTETQRLEYEAKQKNKS